MLFDDELKKNPNKSEQIRTQIEKQN